MLLALEEYFKSPVPETLSLLYNAVNAMDLSLMPQLSLLERHLLQASDNKDLFVEKFEQMIQRRITKDRARAVADQPLDASRSPPKRPGISRAGTKAHFEGQPVYSVPRDTHEFESRVMYKGIPIPIKVPVAVMPETVGDFSLIKLIQNFSDAHTKSPQPFTIHPHLTTNGPNTHPHNRAGQRPADTKARDIPGPQHAFGRGGRGRPGRVCAGLGRRPARLYPSRLSLHGSDQDRRPPERAPASSPA